MNFDFSLLTERLERAYSTRLALRCACLSDAWPLFEATRNPLFNRHLMWEAPNTEQELLQRMDAIVEAARRGRMTALSAVVRKTGEWVSLFRFQPHAQERRAIEMGIWTHDRFWHGNYSLEIGRLCVDAAFEESDAESLIGAAAPENKASCRLMQAVGLQTYRLVTRIKESGASIELMEFKVTRDEWYQLRPALRRYALVPAAAELRERLAPKNAAQAQDADGLEDRSIAA